MAENKEVEKRVNPTLLASWHYVFKVIPLMLAGGLICLGYRLLLLDFEGKIKLSLKAEGVKAEVINASPGVAVIILGAVIVICVIHKGAGFGATQKKDGVTYLCNEKYYSEANAQSKNNTSATNQNTTKTPNKSRG